MKKKLLVVGVLMTLALWIITDRSPIQLLISFIAAGALPVVDVSFSPYIMFGLALLGGIVLVKTLPMFEIRLPIEEEEPEAQIKSLKITQNTHRRRSSTATRKRQKSNASTKKRRRTQPNQQRSKLNKQLAS